MLLSPSLHWLGLIMDIYYLFFPFLVLRGKIIRDIKERFTLYRLGIDSWLWRALWHYSITCFLEYVRLGNSRFSLKCHLASLKRDSPIILQISYSGWGMVLTVLGSKENIMHFSLWQLGRVSLVSLHLTQYCTKYSLSATLSHNSYCNSLVLECTL